MTEKLCIECGINPRKVSRTGKTLTHCDECQRDKWRKRKRDEFGYKPRKKKQKPQQTDNPREDAPTSRTCQECRVHKPINEFGRWGKNYRRVCLVCEALENPPIEVKDGQHVLLVQGDNLILTQVISEKHKAKNLDIVIEMYRKLGYNVVNVLVQDKVMGGKYD